MGDVAACSNARPLKVEFTGTLVGVLGEGDQNAPGFRVYIDAQPLLYQPQPKEPAVEVWPFDTRCFGGGRLLMWRLLSAQLPAGKHTLEIVPVVSSNGQLRIESICVAGE